MTTVEVRGLATGYVSRRGLTVITEGVDASLHSGELTCLLGPNGAGKSTLLRTLSAFQPPLEGEIVVGGRRLDEYSAAGLARVIGVVLTERVNLDNMTVHELVSMGRSPYTGFWGRLSLEDRRVVDHALSLVGIRDLSHRMVHTLSDGERQKVMIAKALAQETPVIFLDEPTAFLDYPSKVEIMQLLQRLARAEGKTVFLSTHDLELALQIADRVWLIDRAYGVEIGVPEDLALSGALGRYFEREGVVFDMGTGLFRIDSRPGRAVQLSGDRHSPCYRMVRKALARVGFLSLPEGEEVPAGTPSASSVPLTVEVTGEEYIVNGTARCGSIARVLEVLGPAEGVSSFCDTDTRIIF